MSRQPKILIVGTQPYNKVVQSRAFDSYFKQFDHANLMQIFSDARTPCKGHCETLIQITDKRLFKRRFNKKIKVSKVFKREELPDHWNEEQSVNRDYKPKKRGPIFRFIRKWIWNKKYWNNEEVENLVKDFNPDYIFIAFSKDFFIFDIAMYFAKKYNVPLILSIADDYVFCNTTKGKLFSKSYRKRYLKMIDTLMKMNVFCIFVSEKIKDKYQKEFGVPGEVIYIASEITPKKCVGLDLNKDWYYFGNIEFGRFDSLNEIALCLEKLNSSIKVHVYTKDYSNLIKTKTSKNLILHPQVPYNELLKILENSGANLVVESFDNHYAKLVEYSLSTKVGDALALGKPIIACGNKDAGAISFLMENDVSYLATDKKELFSMIKKILSKEENHNKYSNQYKLAKEYFSLEKESKKFINLFMK